MVLRIHEIPILKIVTNVFSLAYDHRLYIMTTRDTIMGRYRKCSGQVKLVADLEELKLISSALFDDRPSVVLMGYSSQLYSLRWHALPLQTMCNECMLC